MELRQLRYFAKVCELGTMGRAAVELGLATSALSQQITRLESELGARLLNRSSTGVRPTEAGLAFLHQAQLSLRHADHAALAARHGRLAGHVSVGLSPTTASVLGVPLMQAMAQRYPLVRLHLLETLSGHLAGLLNARQIDVAVLFRLESSPRRSMIPLLDERLYVIGAPGLLHMPTGPQVAVSALVELPLILPSGTHGLRALVNAAFERLHLSPHIVAEIDGLALLMGAVKAGIGATLQPGAVVATLAGSGLVHVPISDSQMVRRNEIASLADEELSPAALVTRVVLGDVARDLVRQGHWPGAVLTNA